MDEDVVDCAPLGFGQPLPDRGSGQAGHGPGQQNGRGHHYAEHLSHLSHQKGRPRSSLRAHPLTAPEKPETIRRWTRRKKMTTGSAIIVQPAIRPA